MHGVFTYCFNVPDSAIDVNRHTNNLEYLRWRHDIAAKHSAACGWPLNRYIATDCSWIVRPHSVEDLRPSFTGDCILLASWLANMEGRSSLRKSLFLEESGRQILGRTQTHWVFVNSRTGRASNIPTALHQAFTTINDEASGHAWLQIPRRAITESTS